MADSGDTLATLGSKLTDLFAGAYAGGNPNVSLVFLPFSVSPPDDIVQDGIVNPAQMAAFLVSNFDAPYLVAPAENAVAGKDDSYGAASQIYATAVSLAQPAPAMGTSAFKNVASEIAMAQSVLSPTYATVNMTCEPDDWVLPANTNYWTAFDSHQTQGSVPAGPGTPSGTTSGPAGNTAAIPPAVPAMRGGVVPLIDAHPINNRVWAIKPAAAAPARVAVPVPLIQRPLNVPATKAVAPAAPVNSAIRLLPIHFLPIMRPGVPSPAPSPPPPPPPPPTSNVSVHFEYMSVTIGYTAAGISVWDRVFLASDDWYISGMKRGDLLPAADTPGSSVYGLPTSLVIVRNVSITVNWAGQDQATLGTSGGFLGPFSLSGVTPTVAPDGTWTYARPGMQVVALLCDHLPVLPPINAPDLPASTEAPATSSGATSGSAGAQTTAATIAPPTATAGATPAPIPPQSTATGAPAPVATAPSSNAPEASAAPANAAPSSSSTATSGT